MVTRLLKPAVLTGLGLLLSGCNAIVLHPAGDVALQQRNLVIISTILMLLIIVPVLVLTFVFAWKYRHTNEKADYQPDWEHSTALELVIWSAPLLIIIALGALTWIGTHTLDPYRPIDRIDASRPVPKDAKTLTVQVVALDWKWLFIYPDYGIAVVNELAAPVDVPIKFQITASNVMNSFYIPALAGQIYAMPAMETQLHAVINAPGEFEGFSANYSGAGFSDMRFHFHGLSAGDFENWIAKVKAAGGELGRETYQKLEQPSERVPVHYYAKADPELYDAIVNLCVDRTKMCMRDMMAIDARGGLGLAAAYNLSHRTYDRALRPGDDSAGVVAVRSEYVTALCATDPAPLSPITGNRSARFAP